MDKQLQLEYESRMRLIDDEAKPLAGSNGQYTRLALVGFKPEKGGDKYFVCFAESQRLFDAVHNKLKTEEWIRDGFSEKWVYIEEVLWRPGPTDDISGYLQALPQEQNDLWLATFNYLARLGVLEKVGNKIKSTSYGLPARDLPKAGFPEGFVFPKRSE